MRRRLYTFADAERVAGVKLEAGCTRESPGWDGGLSASNYDDCIAPQEGIVALRGEGQVCRRDTLEEDTRWRLKGHPE